MKKLEVSTFLLFCYALIRCFLAVVKLNLPQIPQN